LLSVLRNISHLTVWTIEMTQVFLDLLGFSNLVTMRVGRSMGIEEDEPTTKAAVESLGNATPQAL